MSYGRGDVSRREFDELEQIEKELLYRIHMESYKTGGTMPFEYILATFKPRYTFEEITDALTSLRRKGYLRQRSFYESTFQYLEYSEDMEEL
jgi:hypothetical protein